MLSRYQNIRPLLVSISETMKCEVEDNFQAVVRSPHLRDVEELKQQLLNLRGSGLAERLICLIHEGAFKSSHVERMTLTELLLDTTR